jgi:hypothetical protein
MAAALSGRSAKALRRMVKVGELPHEGDGRWVRIPLAAIEQMRGSAVTLEQWAQADAQRRARVRRSTTTTSTTPAVSKRRKGREE